MRTIWQTLVAALVLAAGCSSSVQPSHSLATDTRMSYAQFVKVSSQQSVPQAEGQAWLSKPLMDLNTVLNMYVRAWAWGGPLSEVGGLNLQASAAALAEHDNPQSFCADQSVTFDPNGRALIYCRAAHSGPNRVLASGFILVPYKPFNQALQAVAAQQGRRQAGISVALLLGIYYAQHLRAEFKQYLQQLPQWTPAQQNQQDYCLAGMSVRGYVPPPVEASEWTAALAFVHQFYPPNGGPLVSNPLQLVQLGYRQGELATCLNA